jgi:6-phosphogluconolactonase
MSSRRVVIAANRQELTTLVADKFIVRALKTLERSGRFSVVLTGGSVGVETLADIARHPKSAEVDWSSVFVYWGDERFVPAGHSDRNDQQAADVFLGPLGIPEGNLFRFPAPDGLDVYEAATHFQQRLAPDGSWPEFDLAFAGMGPDGHVLSVFPGRDEALAAEPGILPVTDSPKPPPQRLTMTIPLLNRATRVWMVVAGADKAAAMGLALADMNTVEVPAAGLRGAQSTKIFIDQELASALPQELLATDQFWTAADERADYVPKALR